jgi:hypothetical protein
MPRGGRRPGAGAPRGNTNALRSGNHSRRMREAWRALQLLVEQWDEPKLRAIIAAIRAAGLLGSSEFIRANMPQLVQLIHPMLVDCPPTPVNQTNQRAAVPAPAQRAGSAAPESETSAPTAATPANQPNRETTTDNQNPEVS